MQMTSDEEHSMLVVISRTAPQSAAKRAAVFAVFSSRRHGFGSIVRFRRYSNRPRTYSAAVAVVLPVPK